MWWDRERPWVVLVPPVMAGLFTVLFFVLFDWYDNLHNPIPGQVAVAAGVLGFLAGIAAQRVTRWELLGIPGTLTLAVALWAYVAPAKTPEERDFRQILWLLTAVLALTTVAINLPQIARGRYAPPTEEEETAA
ncbi:MAG: hypothetical protein C4290_12025 [Chloroflexota bacterium]